MKSTGIALMAGMLCLGGCAAPAKPPSQATAPAATPAIAAVKPTIAPREAPAAKEAASPMAALQAHSPPPPEPDAIIKLDPGTEKFSAEMERRLAAIAAQALSDERLIVRLESYVPDGGSPALSIGVAEKILQKVKERLQALGVTPRRILLASFGSEHRIQRDPSRHWVEAYFLPSAY